MTATSKPTVRDLHEYDREARNMISGLSKEGRSSLKEAGVMERILDLIEKLIDVIVLRLLKEYKRYGVKFYL